MMKFAFLFLLFFIYYIAGMYENPALMVLFLTQFLLMGVMFVLSFYLKRHFQVSFMDRTVWAEKDRSFQWSLRTDNRGRLPVSRFVLEYRIFRQGERRGLREKVKGSGDCGIHRLTQEETAGSCGIFIFRAERLKVFDYLALFSGKKSLEDEMEVVVFPKRYEMRIETESFAEGDGTEYRQDSFAPGNDYDEVRQIREYREGDSVRHIHWNQTAKSGQLWVKEYADDFYTLFYALVSGLLRTLPSVCVFWRDKGAEGISGYEVRDDVQCRDLIHRLYRITGSGSGGAGSTDNGSEDLGGEDLGSADTGIDKKESRNKGEDSMMRITRDLSWYVGDRLIFRFSGQKLEEELAERTYRI